MTTVLNSIIIKIIKQLPKSIVWNFASKYVAGETHKAALNVIKRLNQKGFSATIDILGEHVKDTAEATMITSEYIKLFDEIANNRLDCNISIKPTHIGLDINEDEFFRNIELLTKKAQFHNNFLRIDMENSAATNITIKAYEQMMQQRNSEMANHISQMRV